MTLVIGSDLFSAETFGLIDFDATFAKIFPSLMHRYRLSWNDFFRSTTTQKGPYFLIRPGYMIFFLCVKSVFACPTENSPSTDIVERYFLKNFKSQKSQIKVFFALTNVYCYLWNKSFTTTWITWCELLMEPYLKHFNIKNNYIIQFFFLII